MIMEGNAGGKSNNIWASKRQEYKVFDDMKESTMEGKIEKLQNDFMEYVKAKIVYCDPCKILKESILKNGAGAARDWKGEICGGGNSILQRYWVMRVGIEQIKEGGSMEDKECDCEKTKQETVRVNNTVVGDISMVVGDLSTISANKKKETYAQIGARIGKLVQKKNIAYGDSFNKSCEMLKILYPNGVTTDQYTDLLSIARIIDKLFRIATQKDAFGESPYGDIAGYGILGVEKDA